MTTAFLVADDHRDGGARSPTGWPSTTTVPDELDAVALVDDEGRMVWDLPLLQLLINPGDTVLADLVGEAEPVTVGIHAAVDQVAERLIDARRMSVVVVDDDDRPVGRILADDVIDALMPERAASTSRGCCSEGWRPVTADGRGRPPCRRRGQPVVPRLLRLPGRGRARADRRQRRQRRRGCGHLRVGRGPVRLPAALLHGPRHRRLRLRPGDGGPAGRPHRQGPGRPHPRAVLPAAVGLRRARLRHRQPGPGGHRVRRHRHAPSSCSACRATSRCPSPPWPSGCWSSSAPTGTRSGSSSC